MFENYKVVIVEHDFYARNAINSYLAWDRRTRVTKLVPSLDSLANYLNKTINAEKPDTILLDSALLATPEQTTVAIKRIHQLSPHSNVVVMAHVVHPEIAVAAHKAGARGYVDRADVGLQISWMIVWQAEHEFITTPKTAHLFDDAAVLPDGRAYPELTDRVRQALMLCVVEGMTADLAADEMGLSPHTIRTYIKEGYSILEAYDDKEYPAELSPQEKAFMRFTALAVEDLDKKVDLSEDD